MPFLPPNQQRQSTEGLLNSVFCIMIEAHTENKKRKEKEKRETY